jgi:hypothetical protein
MLSLNKKAFLYISLLLCLDIYARPGVTVGWGLDGVGRYVEKKDTIVQATVNGAKKRGKIETFRHFQPNENYYTLIDEFYKRHGALLDNFRKISKDSEGIDKKKFGEYCEKEDPRFVAIARELAPSLRFDFIGAIKNYILDSIQIRTKIFEEFKGGGFSFTSEWYDIELRHKVGSHTYVLDHPMVFNGRGQVVLRFWSDNYNCFYASTPVGCYTIEITFFLQVDGKRISISTGSFMIDV